MIPLKRNVQNKQIYRDVKWISYCQWLGGKGEHRMEANDYGVFYVCDESILKLEEIVAQFCDYTEKHQIIKF